MNEQKCMWKILVPKSYPDGAEISVNDHKIWDNEVSKLAGGLTIYNSVKGRWLDPKGDLIAESVIECAIACTFEEIRRVAQFTKEHYNQKSVCFWKVSDAVYFIGD